MLFAVPIVGKILAGAAASEVSAASTTQTTDAKKTNGAPAVADFTQTVDTLDSTAAAHAAHHSGGAANG
jgi:hypothetical protein